MKEELKISSLYQAPYATVAAPLLERFEYPWEVLDEISDFIRELGPRLPKDSYRQYASDVWIGDGVTVAESATVKGPCIICAGAEVRPGAFIRGGVIVGAYAVVGNSTELKNCILFDRVQVPHYNYVGDSILGYFAHMGAGAITSNVKSDKSDVSITIGGDRIYTGRRKLGAMLGDYVEIGCNSVLNPGTVIGARSNVYPLSSVRGFVPRAHIFKSQDNVTKKKSF